jgi:hypothetical protein
MSGDTRTHEPPGAEPGENDIVHRVDHKKPLAPFPSSWHP